MVDNTIKVDIFANDSASAELKKIQSNLDKISKKATVTQKSLGRIKQFAKVGVILAAAYKVILKPLMDREKYIAGIKTVATSQEDYARSLNYLDDISKTLPFHINELTKSFTFFRKKGIDPLNSQIMLAVGNTAAALGQQFDQVSNALGHVMLGDYGYLKNIGMAARQNGRGVDIEYYNKAGERQILSFSNKHNRQAIMEYLATNLNEKYAGAASNSAKTLSGLMMRLTNLFYKFIDAISSSYFFNAIKNNVSAFVDFAERLSKNDKFIYFLRVVDLLFTSLKLALDGIIKSIGLILKTLYDWISPIFFWLLPNFSLPKLPELTATPVAVASQKKTTMDVKFSNAPAGLTVNSVSQNFDINTQITQSGYLAYA